MLSSIEILFPRLASYPMHSSAPQNTWQKCNPSDMAEFHDCEIFLYIKYIFPFQLYRNFLVNIGYPLAEYCHSNQPILEMLNFVLIFYILQNVRIIGESDISLLKGVLFPLYSLVHLCQ